MSARQPKELNVTPAAVSHQIRLLEEHVGTDLFIRGSRGLVLTPAGSQFYQHVSDAFDHLVEAHGISPAHARKRFACTACRALRAAGSCRAWPGSMRKIPG